jgi:hypothetical protein
MNLTKIVPKPVVCRQSCITCALSCERKWYYRFRLGIALRGVEIKESADLGKIFHKFMEVGPERKDEVLKWVRQRQTDLMKRVDAGEDLDGSIIRLANMLTDLYNKAEVMATLFWKKYPQPDYLETIGTEIKISVQSNYGIPIEGTVDKLLRDTKTGNYWIRDYKSTGRSLARIFGGLPWSIQARIYRLLGLGVLDSMGLWKDNSQLKGFILDGILKPGIKLCRTDEKNAKSWGCNVEKAYLQRVEEWYKEKDEDAILSKAMIYNEPTLPQELAETLTFMRGLSTRPPDDPENFLRDITRRTCFEYEKQCIYHDLCKTPVAYWDSLFESKYKFVGTEEKNGEEEDNQETF